VSNAKRAPQPMRTIDKSPYINIVGSEQERGLGNITPAHVLERALDHFTFPPAIARAGFPDVNGVISLWS
jgi:hypothetical protein